MTDTIRLTDDEIRTGISLEIQAAEANARLRAIQDAAHVFAQQMRNKYKVSDQYQMTDWISGFVKVDNSAATVRSNGRLVETEE